MRQIFKNARFVFETSFGSLLFAAFYAIALIVIGYTAVIQGVSNFYTVSAFRSGSLAAAEAAINADPENPDAYKTLGVLLLRQKNYGKAVGAFDQAIALRENDFLLWLRRGYAVYRSGDAPASEPAYLRAISLAPNYAQPDYYFGKMLLETSRTGEAFSYLSRAAERNPFLYAEILHLARLSYPTDAIAIERAAPPTSVAAKLTFASYLLKHSLTTPGLMSFLTGSEISEADKDTFTKTLLTTHNFDAAFAVWKSKFTGQNVDTEASVFDGGFELISKTDPSGLGWQIDHKPPAVSASRTNSAVRSGATALELKFGGDFEAGRKILSQLIRVQPRQPYRLTFFYRSAELVSAGLPSVSIATAADNRILAAPALLRTTNDKWTPATIEFTTDDSSVVVISLQRNVCDTSPCPIFGEVVLDDFSVSER